MKYTLVAMPQDNILKQINEIRNHLYLNDFRYINRPLKDDSHITLAQVEINDLQSIKAIKNQFALILKGQLKFQIKYNKIENREHKRIYDRPEFLAKYPNGCSRIALLFNDLNLKELAKKIISCSQGLRIDATYQYATNIANSQSKTITEASILDYIADHMNICNYARLERSDEARQYFIDNFKDDIIIDKVGLVSEDQSLKRVIPLH